jgi:hypothetical protein
LKSSHIEDVGESDNITNPRKIGFGNRDLTELLKIRTSGKLCYSRPVRFSGCLTKELIFFTTLYSVAFISIRTTFYIDVAYRSKSIQKVVLAEKDTTQNTTKHDPTIHYLQQLHSVVSIATGYGLDD